MKVKLNYGKIPIVDETLDMCDLITEIGKSCPVKAGPFKVVLIHDIPDYIPSVSTETLSPSDIYNNIIVIVYRANTQGRLNIMIKMAKNWDVLISN